MYLFMVRDRLQASLSELINFCLPWNHQKTYGLDVEFWDDL